MNKPKDWRSNAGSYRDPKANAARKTGPGRLIRGKTQRVGRTRSEPEHGSSECKIASLEQGSHPAKKKGGRY